MYVTGHFDKQCFKINKNEFTVYLELQIGFRESVSNGFMVDV